MSLRENEIHLQTEIRNTGSVRAEFSEYQHNFVAIDDLPVQKGYRLEIPFDQTIDQLPERFVLQSDYTARAESSVRVEGQTVVWTDGMAGSYFTSKARLRYRKRWILSRGGWFYGALNTVSVRRSIAESALIPVKCKPIRDIGFLNHKGGIR